MLNTARVAYFLALVLACTVAGSNRVANATPQAPANKPPRWPITIPHDTNGLKDCGTDSHCFLAALEDGKPAKLQRTRRLSEEGTNIIETSYVQVSNFTDDQCTYFARLEDINVMFTDEARAKLRQEASLRLRSMRSVTSRGSISVKSACVCLTGPHWSR